MSDLIERQAAVDDLHDKDPSQIWDTADVEVWLNALPPAQPERTGRWIPQDHNHICGNVSTCMYFYPVCSECGHTGDFNMNYCPNCGAKMEVEHDR